MTYKTGKPRFSFGPGECPRGRIDHARALREYRREGYHAQLAREIVARECAEAAMFGDRKGGSPP